LVELIGLTLKRSCAHNSAISFGISAVNTTLSPFADESKKDMPRAVPAGLNALIFAFSRGSLNSVDFGGVAVNGIADNRITAIG